MDWLSHIPTTVWIAIVAALTTAMINRAGSIKVSADADGWFRLRPPLIILAAGLLCATFAAWATMFCVGTLVTAKRDAMLAAAPAALLSILPWYVVYAFLVVGTRFNTDGMEYRGLFRTFSVPWSEIRRIAYQGFWGPYAVTDRGGLLVSMYFKGFRQFIEEAERHGVEIAPQIAKLRTARAEV